ncbi:hypothetical protein FQU75_00245 [Paenibacillus polymyxa]|nr:hypothetical protein FQU75_00245 [Paenibacillus polymyxa]
MNRRFKQTIFIFLFIFVLFITGCTANGERSVSTPTQTSGNEITNDPQDDIVYVDDETKHIAMVLSMARAFLSEKDPHYQELMAGSVEDSADILKNEDVRGKFVEVVKYMRQSDKEQVRKICDEIEAEYVTKYSWKRDS